MQKFYFLTLLLFILANLYLCKCQNPTIKIANGYISGTSEKTQYDQNIYHAYKGIRYGHAERFQPASAVKQWNGVYNATYDKPTCVQVPKGNFPEAEDCLFLSVYVPKIPNTAPGLLSVMFWIYGGSYLNGDSLYTSYGPDYLLDDNVIIVTINHRMGVFGFLSTGDDTLPGNLGLKDLVLGLQWVQTNIKFFGGDPKNVTLFGQSSGAILVSYLTLSPLTQGKGYFKGAILESATTLGIFSFQRNPMEIFNTVAFSSPCKLHIAAGPRAVIDCLKQLSPDQLTQSTATALQVLTIETLGITVLAPLAPVLEKPSKTAALTEPTYRKLLKRKTKTVPMIVGTNSEEALMFNPSIFVQPEMVEYINILILLKGLVPVDMYIKDPAIKLKVEQIIQDYYFKEGLVITSTNAELKRFVTENYFIRQWRQFLTMVEKKSPTYCYVFSYSSEMGLNGTRPAGPAYKGLGRVGHEEEVNYLFRNHYSQGTNFPRHDYVVRKRLLKLWTNFAKYGNPTPHQEDILQNVTWHTSIYNGRSNNCLNISSDLSETQNFKEEAYMMWKNLYDTYGHPIDTY